MEILLQVMLLTTSVCVVGAVLRRAGKKQHGASIEAGAVSRGWLAEYKVKRKDWSGLD